MPPWLNTAFIIVALIIVASYIALVSDAMSRLEHKSGIGYFKTLSVAFLLGVCPILPILILIHLPKPPKGKKETNEN